MQNLVGTLAKVAVGAFLARGVGKMMGGSQQESQQQSGLGGLLGSVLGGKSNAFNSLQGGGGLAGQLGSLLGGGQGAPQSRSGGLGSLLDSLGGKTAPNLQPSSSGLSLGGMLNAALRGESTESNTSDQTEREAQILLQAMIAAAKCDGHVDESEQKRILGKIGEISNTEEQFLRHQMAATFDMQTFVRTVPSGMEQQVYLMSLLAIDLDSQAEAQYLDSLRRELKLSEQQCNGIHHQLGVQALYH